MRPTQPDKKPTSKREPDSWQSARSIYNARKRLLAKASALLADAPLAVQALVESHEAADLDTPIVVPQSSDDETE